MMAVSWPTINLRDIGPEQAEELKTHYFAKGLAAATICRRLKMARMFFARAKTFQLISENPFLGVKSKNSTAPERQRYIGIEDTRRLIDKANPTWRTIIALARFAGLRCPSEVLSLRWEDVDLPGGRMIVTSPKTEHLTGRGSRVVPIFAALRPYLQDAYELAEPGTIYVVSGPQADGYRAASKGSLGWNGANLRTTFLKLIKRAGLQSWPRPFHNLRASLETDLMARHPIHVVTAWVGNTPSIALGHYLQTLETDFAKAVQPGTESGTVGTELAQFAAQAGSDTERHENTNATEKPENGPFHRVVSESAVYCEDEKVVAEGIEHSNNTTCFQEVSPLLCANCGSTHFDDPRLMTIVRLWPLLSDSVRDDLEAMAEAGAEHLNTATAV
ncbi:hypothetical protein BH11PLA2_BH11PLA2_23370 [soil metagenome]